MPKFYGQNKKRRNPRYFLNEGRSPEEMIDTYKSAEHGQGHMRTSGSKQWAMARNDHMDMADGGDGGGIRQQYYPEWTDDMFQQVVDAMEGGKDPMSPPWEEPGLARKAAMGRAQDLAQQGMAANDPSSLSTEELQARIETLQAELLNRSPKEN